MDDWMNIISKRELSQDEIRKLKFRPKKVEAAERKLRQRQRQNSSFVPRQKKNPNLAPAKSRLVPTQQRIDKEKEQIDQKVSQATSDIDNKSTAGRLKSKQKLMEELVRITGDKNAVMNIKGAATTEKLTQAIQEAAKNKKEKLQQSRNPRTKPVETEESKRKERIKAGPSPDELSMERRIKNINEGDKMKETPAEKPAPQKPSYKIEPGLKQSLETYIKTEANKTKDPLTKQRLLDLFNVLRGQQ